MLKVKFSAFALDGTAVTLEQVLDQVGDQSWLWTLLTFEATSLVNSDLDVIDLERRAERTESGVEISPHGLRELAKKIDQTINIHLVANVISGKAVFVLQAIDSTEWEVSAEDSDAAAVGAFLRVHERAKMGAWRPELGDESGANSVTAEEGFDSGQ